MTNCYLVACCKQEGFAAHHLDAGRLRKSAAAAAGPAAVASITRGRRRGAGVTV
jgi:hypothetical protein